MRVVDLRTEATITGPIIAACFGATMGHSGTLVVRRCPTRDHGEIVAAQAAMPERQIADGPPYHPLYQDGILRLFSLTRGSVFDQPLP